MPIDSIPNDNKNTGAQSDLELDSKRDSINFSIQDSEQLLQLAQYRMPFGKYTNRLLVDLPEPYVVWFAKKGFPDGKLGEMLKIVHEIKINGLEYLFDPLKPKN